MKIKLTTKQHNKLFKYRKVKFLTYYEIIDNPEKRDIEMYQRIRFLARILVFMLSPLAIFIGGMPSMITLIKECLSNKEVGADTINREWFYSELERIRNDH